MARAFDVAIVGAGPAGMAAALAATGAGLSVVVFDEQAAPGGQIYRGLETCPPERLAILGPSYVAGTGLLKAFRSSSALFCGDHQVWFAEREGTLYTRSAGRIEKWQWRRLVIATGAMERPVPRPGWDLPGVRTVGAAQIMLKTGGHLPPEDTWIVGAGPLPLLFAHQLVAAGARIAGMVETTPRKNRWSALRRLASATGDIRSVRLGLKYRREATAGNYVRHASGIAMIGNGAVEALRFTRAGSTFEHRTSTVLLHEGIVPGTAMAAMLGCRQRWHPDQRYFLTERDSFGRTSVPGILIAGDGAEIGGADAARAAGTLAGLAAARDLAAANGYSAEVEAAATRSYARAMRIRPFLDALYSPAPELRDPPAETLVCRCEAVSAQQISAALREGAAGVNEVKAFTRAGMGPCQGKMCGLSVAEITAAYLGADVEDVGTYRVRPPLKPITLGELAGMT